MRSFLTNTSWKAARSGLAAGLVACIALPFSTAIAAEQYRLVPQTKLRLTVVQFMPTRGDYQRWDALGGDVMVSSEGTILLPVLGSISIGNLDRAGLAAEIAKRLQAKLGLVNPPDTTVEIVEYPPIYMVGSVSTPGQYQFRPGLTVLQAVALAGGEFRADAKGNLSDTISLQGDIQGSTDDILRSTARISRLQAELSGAKELKFPPELTQSNDPMVADILTQEQTIFAARGNELGRQTSSLTDLTNLYLAEIDVLDQKSKALDQGITRSEQELAGVASLVEKGVATVSRRSDLERALAGQRSDRLDNLIATMTARQGLSETKRNLVKLEDDQRTQISVELQTEQTSLERLRLKQTTSLRLLRQANTITASNQADEAMMKQPLTFTLVRKDDAGGTTEVAATEATLLLPGDLLKVGFGLGTQARTPALAAPAAANSVPSD
jgi:protein involved in polysaccharide export with SLBB domain